MALSVVILAAGKGTRMRSKTPKVLHQLAGKPLLHHVISTAESLRPKNVIVVVGHGKQQIIADTCDPLVQWVEQKEQMGTGHAVQQAMPFIPSDHHVLVLYADVPLIKKETLDSLLDALQKQTLCLLTAQLDEPKGYGRIIRDDDAQVAAIVEQKDATAAQSAIREVNTGIMAARAAELSHLLAQLDCNNTQGEYYLTDIVALAYQANYSPGAHIIDDFYQASGVNDRGQLAVLERIYQHKLAEQLMRRGVTIYDPYRIDIRGHLNIEADSVIDVNCVFVGDNCIASDVRIGSGCTVINSEICTGAVIEPNSIIENAIIGEYCSVGPFARVRPNTVLQAHARLGNFVETKNSKIGRGSKVNHLSYVGDSTLGEQVNIGAGVITANYDGTNKHYTEIDDQAFIGSNSVLVAPIKVGRGSTVGAGTTATQSLGDNALYVTRAKERIIQGWRRPAKSSKK